jgi:N-acetylglucosamine-6-sulfatase
MEQHSSFNLRVSTLSLLPLLFAMLVLQGGHLFAQPCQLPAPTNLATSNVTSCSVTYSWKKVANAKKYKVKYQKVGDVGWSGSTTTKDTFYTFSGLQSFTKYTFSVQASCNGGGVGASATIKQKTEKCTLPVSISTFGISPVEEQISVETSCPFDTLYCHYGTSAVSLELSTYSLSSSVTLAGLQPGTQYYFQVSTCPIKSNNFTSIDSFTTIASRPNIILIVLDDARFDHYSCNGAPDFMQTPNIDRIANEGINFKNSFVVHSECGPSRATIATGVYTVRHKVYDNIHPYLLDSSLAVLPQVMNQNGYYTAMVGKTHQIYTYDGGYFNYWLEYESSVNENKHNFNFNGTDKTIKGYDTDIMSDSTVSVISHAPQPYFIQLGYRAPHDPLNPAPQYDTAFADEVIDMGIDTSQFTQNYPSFLYQLGGGALADAHEAKKNIRETLEMLLSVDDGMGKILNELEEQGELENTMVIFTSDNGHLMGEHRLDAKRFAYEQSMRVPLFIRYPQWFSPGTIDNSNMALNIDYMPTILDAAGISQDTFGFDGESLRNFYTGADSRNTFYYHYWYSPEGSWVNLPPIKAVRDQQYVFIDYGCQSDTVEEFFDLVNDSLQMNNLINNSAYSSLINNYRSMLLSMADELGDTLTDTQLNCTLANPVYNRQEVIIRDLNVVVYPNPFSEDFNVRNFGDGLINLSITDELGKLMNEFTVSGNSQFSIRIPAPGLYFLKVTEAGSKTTQVVKLVAQ